MHWINIARLSDTIGSRRRAVQPSNDTLRRLHELGKIHERTYMIAETGGWETSDRQTQRSKYSRRVAEVATKRSRRYGWRAAIGAGPDDEESTRV